VNKTKEARKGCGQKEHAGAIEASLLIIQVSTKNNNNNKKTL